MADCALVTARTPAPKLPVVTQLSTTAIKGFRLHHPHSITLTAGGVVGDRDFLLVDDDHRSFSVTRTGAFLPYWSHFDPQTQVLSVGRDAQTRLAEQVRTAGPVHARLFAEHYVDGHWVDGPWDAFFSELAGQSVHLVRTTAASDGYDLHPLTLLSEASVAALGREPDGSSMDPRRFRLLISCDAEPAFAEDGWAGTEAEVGSAVLRFGGSVPRCAAVQHHPDHPDHKVNTLRRINQVRGVGPSELGTGLNLGVYAEVRRPGTITVGDELRPVSATG